MIPDESTPVKHKVLIEIIAKGRLSYDEIRIACFIMRWSWGFDEGSRRRDWTKEFSIAEIARAINMDRGLCSKVISKMAREGKLLKQGKQYQFNEHYEQWSVSKTHTVRKTHGERVKNSQGVCEKLTPTVRKTHASPLKSTDENKAVSHPKDILKIYKDNIKIYSNNAQNKKSIKKDEKQLKAKELIKEFCKFRGIPLDSGFFAKNIRAARSLVSYYPVEFILAGIAWRLENDSDGFWHDKLWSLNSVYSHFAEWIAQAKLKTDKTFEGWLSHNPEQDYRKIKEPDAKLRAFFIAFNRALKNGITPSPSEWQKYQKARELNKQSIRR